MQGTKQRERNGANGHGDHRGHPGELMLAVERDQRRLAGVLHNDLQQLLLACRFSSQILLGSRDAKAKDKVALELNDLLDRAMKATRELTTDLGAAESAEDGLACALSRLPAEALGGRRVAVDADPAANPADPTLGAYLLRVVREILRETAGVGDEPVRITMTRDHDERLRLEIDGPMPEFDESASGWSRCAALFGVEVQAGETGVTFLALLA